MAFGFSKHMCIVAAASMIAFLAFTGPAIGADWPVYRGPSHDGFSAEADWKVWGADGPKVLWKASAGMGFSSITVADGKAYVTGNGGKSDATDTVFCLDAVTGKEIWKHKYPCELLPKYYKGGTLASPTVDGDIVYTISKMGDLFCLNAATGKVVWNKQMNKDLGYELPTWHFSGSPMVVGELLVLNLGDAGVALNKKTGDVVWENGKGVCGYATPVPTKFGGTDAVCIAAADSIIGVAIADGKVIWKTKFVNKHKVTAADPIIAGNEIFASSGYNRGCIKVSVDGSNVKQLHDSTNMRNHMNCSMLYDGHLYGFDESSLKCLDFKDCSEKWADKSMGKGGLIMSADGRMIITSDKGELVIAKADPAGFKELARAQVLPGGLCWTGPTLANGRIYARNANGDVVCVDVN